MTTTWGKASLASALLLFLTACSEEKDKNQKTPQSSTKAANGADAGAEDEDEDEAIADTGIDPNDKVFALFCERAAETEVAAEQLADYLAYFCEDGAPTKLLTGSLIAKAYAGKGTPALKTVEEWSEDKKAKTTTGTFGVGIKLPVSMADHFTKVAPLAGNEEALRAQAEGAGAEVETASVLQEFKEEGKYHIRGWETELRSSKQIPGVGIKATAHYIARLDQYELEKDKAYLYTNYLVEGKESFVTMDTLTAGLQIGDDAYLLTVSRLGVGNKGFHKVAVTSLQGLASDVVKGNFDAAKAAE